MLIGGPNQSHKVNFKEPLPLQGKISKKTFAFCTVNTFPVLFEKNVGNEHEVFLNLQSPVSVMLTQMTEGTAENANCIFLIKIFLLKKTNELISNCYTYTSSILNYNNIDLLLVQRNPNSACILPVILYHDIRYDISSAAPQTAP